MFWQQLRHENLVNLLDAWKRRRRWYLVFEFVERTVLDELEQFPSGLDPHRVRKYLYQILRAICFCHQHNVSVCVSTLSALCRSLLSLILCLSLRSFTGMLNRRTFWSLSSVWSSSVTLASPGRCRPLLERFTPITLRRAGIERQSCWWETPDTGSECSTDVLFDSTLYWRL